MYVCVFVFVVSISNVKKTYVRIISPFAHPRILLVLKKWFCHTNTKNTAHTQKNISIVCQNYVTIKTPDNCEKPLL